MIQKWKRKVPERREGKQGNLLKRVAKMTLKKDLEITFVLQSAFVTFCVKTAGALQFSAALFPTVASLQERLVQKLKRLQFSQCAQRHCWIQTCYMQFCHLENIHSVHGTRRGILSLGSHCAASDGRTGGGRGS